ncbi:hypothetical protein [Kaarinaea lacus]
MRALATYLLRGNKEAIIVVLVCSVLALLIPVFGLFNAVIVGLVSLRHGANKGLMLAGISSAVIAAGILLFGALPEGNGSEGLAAIGQWVVSLLGLVALCGILRSTRSLQLTMLSALGAGVAVIVVFRLFVRDTVSWWQNSQFETVKELYNNAVESVLAQQAVVNHQMLESVSAYLVGIVVATFTAGLIIHLFLSRSWQAAMFNPGGFRDEFIQLRFSKNVAIAPIICLVLFMLAGAENFVGYSCLAVIMIFAMLYTIFGIAVIFGVFKARNWHWGIVVGAVVAFLVVGTLQFRSLEYPAVMLILVFAFIGFIDTFLDFRKKAQSQSTE